MKNRKFAFKKKQDLFRTHELIRIMPYSWSAKLCFVAEWWQGLKWLWYHWKEAWVHGWDGKWGRAGWLRDTILMFCFHTASSHGFSSQPWWWASHISSFESCIGATFAECTWSQDSENSPHPWTLWKQVWRQVLKENYYLEGKDTQDE